LEVRLVCKVRLVWKLDLESQNGLESQTAGKSDWLVKSAQAGDEIIEVRVEGKCRLGRRLTLRAKSRVERNPNNL
jgi:hypothetical protein